MTESGLTRRHLLQRGAGGAVLLSAGGLLAACSSESGTSDVPPPKKGGNLRIGVLGGGATDTLDPFHSLSVIDYLRSFALYNGLGELNDEYEFVGLMVEETTPNDDGSIWDVRIKDGIEFHNGKTVTVDDLIASFQLLYDPKNPGTGAGTAPWVDSNQIKKLDERTARFTLTQPASFFKEAIYQDYFYILPADFDVKNPVGAGAFKFESFKAGDRSVFTRFDNYYGETAYVDSLEVIDIKDSTAQINALLSGDIDIAVSIDLAQASSVESGGDRLVTTENMGFHPLTMRVDIPPFNDERVREAFRLIPDRQQMIEQAYSGHGQVGNDLYAIYDKAFASDLPQREQDIDKARSLLAEAGQENLTVELPTSNAFAGWPEAAQSFAEQAKEAGVTVNVRRSDADTYFTQDYLKAPFAQDNWPNWTYFNVTSQAFTPEAPYNTTHVNDKQFNDLYAQALSTVDEDQRIPILQDMQQIQYDTGGWILFGFFDNVDGYKSNIGGFKEGTKATLPLNRFHIEELYIG